MPGTDARLRLTYPEALPITAQRESLLDAIRDNQVVVVAGETGSGKSTQLPKLCLELGRGAEHLIGHTQPRRLAARTVAARIAEELGTEIGDLVGYKVRFSDQVGERTMVKLMTDGILLAELRGDPELRRYDTIIVDEAHERSLNIDFLLGYLTDLVPRRPDLKMIVTSATIDTERFAAHFGAPVVEVSGRNYPVEVRYRPIGEGALARNDGADGSADGGGLPPAVQARGVDQVDAIRLAVDELRREGPGDILVFLSGQREIHDTARALAEAQLPDTEILPLYARLSAAEQQRAFRPHRGRRVVLATNVAETSITVPGVRYVVDTGTARISRYNRRTKLQRLPIEPVSQASADQRAGRCGRVAPGICLRLYGEDDFAARPEFTEPEILRTNLASVILQMAELGLGTVDSAAAPADTTKGDGAGSSAGSFPFIDPPDARAVRDAVALLAELGALSPSSLGRPDRRRSNADTSSDSPERAALALTDDGRRMARLPVDPRFGRMLLAAEANGCLREVTVIVAALSIQDPRERPTGEEQEADEMHARFAVPGSDFLAYLDLWEHLATEQQARSGNGFRRMCRAEHLNHVRVREWQDLVRQLREATHDLGMRRNAKGARRGAARGDDRPTDAAAEAIHRSLLAGLLSHVGMWDRTTRDYRGARQARFTVAPRSVMTRSSAVWVMAGELVETGRLWARMVARVDPSWIEPLAGHLVKRSYAEPRWSRRRGMAVTDERVSLYGLPIVAGRTVPLDRIDPAQARVMFVDHALVDSDWDGLDGGDRYPFVEANRQMLDQARGLEARARRSDLVVGEERLADLYDSRLPDDVVSAPELQRWWKRVARRDPDVLTFTLDDLLGVDAAAIDTGGFPVTWTTGDLVLDLSYGFEPSADDDGVTVHVPLVLLPRIRSEAGFDWHVPGHRLELVTALIRTLPKAIRRELVPAHERAREALGSPKTGTGSAASASATDARASAASVPESVPASGTRAPAQGIGPHDGPLVEVLARRLSTLAGSTVSPADLDVSRLAQHLRLRFSIEDDDGTVVATGRDLGALSTALAARARQAVAAAIPGQVECSGLREWPVGMPSRVLESDVGGRRVVAYPTLVDEGQTVGVRIAVNPADQERLMWGGTCRLLLLAVPRAQAQVERRLRAQPELISATYQPTRHDDLADLATGSRTTTRRRPGPEPAAAPHQADRLNDPADLATDCVTAAADRLLTARGGPAWDEDGYRRLEEAARDRLAPLAGAAAAQAADIVVAASALDARLGEAAPALEPAVADMRSQLSRLVHPGFVTATGLTRLQDLARYVEAIRHRLDKVRERPDRDRDLTTRVRTLEAAYEDLVTPLPAARRAEPQVVETRWMLEELRVSLFAQVLGTARPVSEQRIRRRLASLA